MKTIKFFSKMGFMAVTLCYITSLYSCGGNNSSEQTSSSSSAKLDETVSVSDEKTTTASNGELYKKGEEIYKKNCQACHQANGEGLPNVFPPLAKSDYLLADKARAIRQVLQGSSGEITVNGMKFNSVMPPQNLSVEEVSEVLNYVLHSWGNDGEIVTVDEVKVQKGS